MNFSGWYPVDLSKTDPKKFRWTHFGDQRFTRPFFFDELRGIPYTAYNDMPESMLFEAEHQLDSLTPDAFFFHSSRCGSTLLSQQLAIPERFISLSEPTGLDAILSYSHDRPEEEKILLIRAMVHILGQKRSGHETHYFIKTDSWHIGWLPLIRKAFPDTPLYFLFREPEDILASHKKMAGRQMIPGVVDTRALQPNLAGVEPWDLESYAQRILLRFYELAIEYCQQGDVIPIHYNTLPDIIWSELNNSLHMKLSQTELHNMKSNSHQYSKAPEQSYIPEQSVPDAFAPELSKSYQCLLQAIEI